MSTTKERVRTFLSLDSLKVIRDTLEEYHWKGGIVFRSSTSQLAITSLFQNQHLSSGIYIYM
jgi:hypothetical protein